jgi:hypothetical protein
MIVKIKRSCMLQESRFQKSRFSNKEKKAATNWLRNQDGNEIGELDVACVLAFAEMANITIPRRSRRKKLTADAKLRPLLIVV